MYKLLLIDDEDVIRNGLRVIIERGVKNLQISEASNGREGMERINEHEPDIVITDIRMPHIDGLELIEWVTQNKQKRPAFIIISGFDDFNYAKKAIQYGVKDYLLKPVVKEELIQLLNSITQELDDNIQRHEAELIKAVQGKVGMEVLKERYLNLLIKSAYFDQDAVVKQLLTVGIQFDFELFKIIVVEYKDAKGEPVFNELDRFAIKDAMDAAISNITKGFWSFYDPAMRMIILLSNRDSFLLEAPVKKICEQINRCLVDQLKVSTFFGVGGGVARLSDIWRSYNEALNAVMFKIIHEPGGIVFSKDIADQGANFLSFQEDYHRVTAEIELCMKTNISYLIEEYFHRLEARKTSVSGLMFFYNDFNKYIYDYFCDKGIDFSMVFESGETYFKEFDFFWEVDHLKTYIKEYLTKICDIISAYKNGSPDRKIIEQVIRFMRENYAADINLNIVANHFGKNNSYLSVLFKKETGKNFIDFLTQIRVERAKELLSKSSLKVNDIALKVGYPNPKHFYLVFKKMVGITPMQYRDESM
jgi:two-component system response regulator YesN